MLISSSVVSDVSHASPKPTMAASVLYFVKFSLTWSSFDFKLCIFQAANLRPDRRSLAKGVISVLLLKVNVLLSGTGIFSSSLKKESEKAGKTFILLHGSQYQPISVDPSACSSSCDILRHILWYHLSQRLHWIPTRIFLLHNEPT